MSQASALSLKQRGVPRLSGVLVLVLALLNFIPPLCTDMYLAAFPQMAAGLSTTATMVQLTLTAFMIGLGVGQLLVGPLSDAVGRRRPLLVCTTLCLAASVVCALAPSVTVLITARLVQGLTSAASVVLGRAIIADLAKGPSVVRLMNVLMTVGAIAPVLAPVLGGQIAAWSGWRGVFWVITGTMAIMLFASVSAVPESLTPEKRQAGRLKELIQGVCVVLGDHSYVAYLATVIGCSGTMFAYISGSSFVLQEHMGLSAKTYSLIFGLNSVGMMLATSVSMRLAGWVKTLNLVRIGATILVLGSIAWLILTTVELPMIPALITLFSTTSAQGLIIGNATGLAVDHARDHAGTASAFLGALQYGFAAAVTPLVGLGYQPRTMGIVMLSCSVLALAPIIRPPKSQGNSISGQDGPALPGSKSR